VGGVLLTLGAVALVAAGIVFTAVAWSFLGPVGRFLLLLVAGAVALLAARLTARRIHGTATALAVVGAGLVSVATAFLLSRGDDLDTGPRAAVAAAVGVGLLFVGRRLSPLLRASALVTAVAGAVFVAAALLTVGETAEAVSTEWWSAGVFAVWGLALLAWARVDRTAPWSWLGTAGLVQAVLLATAAATTKDGPLDLDQDWAALALPMVLLAGALLLLLLDRLLRARTWALPFGGVLLTAIAGIAALAGAADGSSSGWGAAAVAVVAIGVVLVGAHVAARPERPTATVWQPVLRPATVRVITAVVAIATTVAALAFALAVTSAPPVPQVVCGAFDCTPSRAFTAWIDESFPAVRGALAAVVALAFGLALGAVLRLRRGPGHAGPAVAASSAVVLVWSAIVVDATVVASTSTPLVPTRTIGVAWLVAGLGGIALAALLRGVPWLVQAPGALAALGVQLLWSTLGTDGWAWAPEAHGLLLAAPLLLAGMTQVLLDPKPVPTLASVGPALSAVLLPPTLAVLDDTSDRWASALFGGNADPSTEALVRSVVLVLVAAVLVVLGARRGWAGVFWPGVAALVLLVAAQLFDAAALLPAWVSLALVGLVLVLAGARWEQVRLRGRRTRQWAARLH
jgi:hypothetical protein